MHPVSPSKFGLVMPSPQRRLVAAMACALLLVGCGADAPVADSQVAVRVNKGEISVHQVQAVMKRQPRLAAEQVNAASSRVLEALIDQELAAQAAVDKGLERDPDVVQALQLARREVLARAYQEQLAAQVVGPSWHAWLADPTLADAILDRTNAAFRYPSVGATSMR